MTIQTKQESTTPLGSSASVFGGSRDMTAGGPTTRFRVFAAADQAGTVQVQASYNGGVWWTTNSAAIVAGQGTVLEATPATRYVRGVVINGGSAQGVLEFDTAIVN